MASDNEDFMSDTFLATLEQSTGSSSKERPLTYTERRALAQKQAEQNQRVNRTKSLREREAETRKKGLETSLFGDLLDGEEDSEKDETPGAPLGGKAMKMMMNMGWKPGEGLGKTSEEQKTLDEDVGHKRKRDPDMSEGAEVETPKETRPLSTNRTEPIKITMWSGKAGVGARPKSPSPSPLTQSQEHQFETGTVGDVPLPAEKMAKLNADAEEFRERQMVINEQKRTEARQWAARALLMKLDEEDGKKFHPLYIIPQDPIRTMPSKLGDLIFPDEDFETNLFSADATANRSSAEKLKRQMDDERLDDLEDENDHDNNDDDDEEMQGPMKLGDLASAAKKAVEAEDLSVPKPDILADDEGKFNAVNEEVDWGKEVAGVKRVLGMDPKTHLGFLVDELRQNHMYCFWCQQKYRTFEEMDGPGGCPGEEEDVH